MGRREVIEIECDRCARVQTQAKTEVFEGDGAECELTFRGKKVKYDDLCKTCRRTIANYVERILKVTPDEKPDKKKNAKGSKAKSGAQAASAS